MCIYIQLRDISVKRKIDRRRDQKRGDIHSNLHANAGNFANSYTYTRIYLQAFNINHKSNDMDSGVFLKMSVQCVSPKIPVGPSMIRAIGGSVEERRTSGSLPRRVSRRPLEFLRIGGGKVRKESVRDDDDDDAVLLEREEERNGNWVLKILEVGSIWKGKRQRSGGGDGEDEEEGSKKDESCDLCRIDEEEEEEMVFDRENFSKMLMKIPLDDAQMFAKLSYLGNLAYSIPNIKVKEDLLQIQTKLHFSSVFLILCFFTA